MACTSSLPALLLFAAAVACCSGQFLKCGFRYSCDGFITSIDNDFNKDSDVPWTRVSRLQTSNFKARIGDTFLSIYQDAADANTTSPPRVTSRLVIPAPEHVSDQGCLRLRYVLVNGKMTIREFETGATRSVDIPSSDARVIEVYEKSLPLDRDNGRTLLEVELERGVRSEFGLDSVRMYDELCPYVANYNDGGFGPTWPPLTTTTIAPPKGAQGNTADPGGAAGGVRSAAALVILMLAVTLVVGPHALR